MGTVIASLSLPPSRPMRVDVESTRPPSYTTGRMRALRNGSSCVASAPIVSGVSLCIDANEGQLRYNEGIKNLEVCNGNEWVRPGKPAVGHTQSVPATSCR